jgi:hypothetical protein
MKFKKQIAMALAAITAFSCFAACAPADSSSVSNEGAPDYSMYDNQFLFYCYAPPNDGTWKADDGTPMYAGEDFRVAERYKEYMDCGFDILMMQFSGKFDGTQTWEESDTKMVMDQALEAGMDKIIVTDTRLQELSEGIVYLNEEGKPDPEGKKEGNSIRLADLNRNGIKMEIDIKEHLVGEDRPFATDAELDAYVRYCMTPYMSYDGFYGVQLKDEPNFKHVTFYGDTYRSIKRVCPNAFIQYNLNQIYTNPTYFWGYPGWEGSTTAYFDKNFPGWRDGANVDISESAIKTLMIEEAARDGNTLLAEDITPYQVSCKIDELLEDYIDLAITTNKDAVEEDGYERYGNYLRAYIDNTGADYIMWDSYPLRGSDVRTEYIRSLQVTANVCKEKGVAFANTTQAHSEVAANNKQVKMRALDEEDARWLNNMLLGMGVKQIVYYTYFNKGRSEDTIHPDGTTFITHYGEKTERYYFMQKILAENQKFAPTILNFDYVTSNAYAVTPSTYSSTHVKYCEKNNTFQKVKAFEINKECALVTELYDDENNRYMYMVQNVVDPDYQGAKAYQTATITFTSGYTRALVYKNGEVTNVALQGGKYTVKQHAGEAVFILPY